ncbi:MAG: bifunctional phosphoglucose/phosphomannose isomerase [Bacteroidetes bacterium]|nr:bifunctional phosphoglucose/phosphomannose isomerase [Bacteroidota bacterium]MCY4205937.1 bifunctional phosphoglucose/phosphomannose isomerase [Bacteroidota bacterium]
MTKKTLDQIDLEGMYEAVRSFPDQLRQGRANAMQAKISGWPGDGVTGVVVAGMGGSAIGGDILATLAIDHASIPVVVSRSYLLPAWVGPDTVVVTSSYSGNTEETLAAFDDACARGARVVAISTGGELTARAQEKHIPCMQLPTGIQPRAALPHSLSALLTITESLQLTAVKMQDWDEAIAITAVQSELMSNVSDPDNLAIKLADILYGQFPVIYSSEQFAVANIRWRNQIHENSKSFAVGNLLPEMNHNEVMGWARFQSELKQLAVIALRDFEDHERTQRRLDVTRSLLEPHAHSWNEVHSEGKSRLARLLSIMYLGDWVSLYLAILNEIDPSPVGLISKLKTALIQDS